MQNKFTQKAQSTLTRAAEQAGSLGHVYIGSEHLLLGLALEKDSIAARVLFARGLSPTLIKGSIIEVCGEGEVCTVSPRDLTPRARKIIEDSGNIARANGCTYIGTEHLLQALLCEETCMAVRLIEASGVPCALLQGDLSAHQSSASPQKKDPKQKEGEAQRSRSKSALATYTRDMCALAAEGKTDPVIGRESETDRIIRILCRRSKNNPCLVGEPGVGKTAVVEGLARLIADGKAPPALAKKRILSLDIPSMIAGAKYRGEFEERMKNVINEARSDDSAILFVDELHVIVGAGAAEGAVDAANILKPALARGEIRMIGATTLTEYKRHIERDSALERRFQPVAIKQPDLRQTIDILCGLRTRLEEHHGVSISDEAIERAVYLSERYIADRFQPDKSIDLIDEAAARLSIESADGGNDTQDKKDKKKRATPPTLEARHIEQTVTELTDIPAERVGRDEQSALRELEARLERRVMGQPDAIRTVAGAIRRGRVGLKDPKRPTGAFLFVGSTGVGKTELAAALCEELMGSRDALLRFDMSEYTEKHSIAKLIGSPPGYVGYGEGGQLTERVRRRPYSVVLFDEIEKAHPDIYDLLLQILDDGRLTDSEGRTVSFRDTVIIMTSNVGASRCLCHSVGFGDLNDRQREREGIIKDALRDTFSPEFLGRIDAIVTFNELDESALCEIASKQLGELEARARSMGYDVSFEPELSALIARHAFGKASGARELRRVITRSVEEYLSVAILSGTLIKGEPALVGKEALIDIPD